MLGYLLNITITGSLFLLLLLLFHKFLKKHLSARWQKGLLLLACLLFVVPAAYLPCSAWFSQPLQKIQPHQSVNQATLPELTTPVDNPFNAELALPNQPAANTQPVTVSNTDTARFAPWQILATVPWPQLILAIWLAGVVALAIYRAVAYRRFQWQLKSNRQLINDVEYQALFQKSCNDLNIKRRISFYWCSFLAVPMASGLLYTAVYLPERSYQPANLKMVLKHELTHCRQLDLWLKMFGLAVNTLCWFNPLTYWLLKNLETVCEKAVDQAVTQSMQLTEKRLYAETLLDSLAFRQQYCSAFSTAICANKTQMKARLKQIMQPMKLNKTKSFFAILLVALLVFFSTAASNFAYTVTQRQPELAVFTAANGLYQLELASGQTVCMDSSSNLIQPVISPTGDYVAYTGGEALYVMNLKNQSKTKVANKIASYDWANQQTLVYASQSTPGLYQYQVNTKTKKTWSNTSLYYSTIVCDRNGAVYVNKVRQWQDQEGNEYGANLGIYRYTLNDNREMLVLASRPGTDDELGTRPEVAKISDDGRWVYIWEKPAAGSVTADGVSLGVWDTQNQKFFSGEAWMPDNESGYGILAYNDGLAVNPKNGAGIAVNAGGGREMFQNKRIVLFDEAKQQQTTVSLPALITKTPAFSQDGSKVYYSGTASIEARQQPYFSDYDAIWKQWGQQQHAIYQYHCLTGETQQLTQTAGNTSYFDFLPTELNNGILLFLRDTGATLSLWQLKNGVESQLSGNINNNEEYGNFYGHDDTQSFIDFHLLSR